MACEACGRELHERRLGTQCVLLECPACGHVVRDLRRCRAGAREHPWGGNQAFDRVRLALTRGRISRLLPGRGPFDILEIGFGTGRLLAGFLARGHRVSGVDRGTLGLELAEPLRTEATVYAQAAESVDLPDEAFDLVYGIHVAEHLEDPAAVFASSFHALRPGALLYLMTPNAGSEGLRLFGDRWWNLEDPTHVRFFSPRSIGLMLGRAGFERMRVRTPRWDSLTLEVSSLIRVLRRNSTEHGVLATRAALPIYALTPLALAARMVRPRLSPSMEVVARKPAGGHEGPA